MADPIKIHPLDLAEIINTRTKCGFVDFYTNVSKDIVETEEIAIDGKIYVQDINAIRKL